MTLRHLVAGCTLLAALAGCGSGDVNIEPATSVANSNNTTNNGGGNGGTTNPCASYVNTAGQTIRGTYDSTNCTYAPSFVDSGNNLTVDMTIRICRTTAPTSFRAACSSATTTRRTQPWPRPASRKAATVRS